MDTRQHAHDFLFAGVDADIGADSVQYVDGFRLAQFPRTAAERVRLVGERAHRTKVDRVTGKLGFKRTAQERGDLGMLAATEHAQLHDAGDFLTEPHAAGALDTTRHFLGRDQRPEILVKHDALFFVVARRIAAVTHGDILQLAFPALIADRAIQGMVDQQELHHALLGRDRAHRARMDHHAAGCGCGAGGHRLRGLLDLDQAHPAVGRDGQLLVIAKMRHVHAELVGRMHDHAALLHFDFLAVDG